MSYCCVPSSRSKRPASRANPYVLATDLMGCGRDHLLFLDVLVYFLLMDLTKFLILLRR